MNREHPLLTPSSHPFPPCWLPTLQVPDPLASALWLGQVTTVSDPWVMERNQ